MTRGELLKEINKMMMVTSSKYLDDVIESKNKILDGFDELFVQQEQQEQKQQKAMLAKNTQNQLMDYTNINQDAFNEWMKYKKYKNKGAITKTLNMLNKYDYQTQQEMVDKSIMNEYKGLFEPKQNQKQKNDKQVNAALDNNVFDLIEQRAEENRQSAEEYYSLTTDIGTKHG